MLNDISKLLPAIKEAKDYMDQDVQKSNVNYTQDTFYENNSPAPNMNAPINESDFEDRYDDFIDNAVPQPRQTPQVQQTPTQGSDPLLNRYSKEFLSEDEYKKALNNPKVPQNFRESFAAMPPLQGQEMNTLTEDQIRMVNPNFKQGNPSPPQQKRPIQQTRNVATVANNDNLRQIVREELERIFGKLMLESGSRQNLLETLNLNVNDDIKIVIDNKAYFADIYDVKKIKIR